ncbi:MAG: protoheme IX farnesyltransferase, partial [Pseudomonadota bacterium]
HGVAFTKLSVFVYTVLLVIVTLLPWLAGMSGFIYLASALVLGAVFLCHAIRLSRDADDDAAMPMFTYSINYLMLLFAALLADHYLV